MKNIKKIYLALLMLLMCLNLSGCTKLFIEKPISFSDEFDQINEAIRKASYKKSNLKLVAPKAGEHQLAINKFTDNLNRTFAVALGSYENNFEQNNLRMVVLQKNEKNEWQQLINVPVNGNEIDKLIFLQNKNTSSTFIIVGYRLVNHQSKSLISTFLRFPKSFSIYELKPDNFQLQGNSSENEYFKCHITDFPYETMELFNLNNSDKKNLVVVSDATIKRTKMALSIFGLNNGKMERKANVIFSNLAYNNYDKISMKLDKLSFGKPAIFLNFKNGLTTKTTIFLLHEIKNSFNFEEIYEKSEPNLTVNCFDFDGDGRVEMPVVQLFPGYEISNFEIVPKRKKNEPSQSKWLKSAGSLIFSIDSNTPKCPKIIDWTKLSLENNKIKQEATSTYTNFAQGYYFVLPNSWYNKVSARFVNTTNTIEFFEFDGSIENNKNKILTLSSSQTIDSQLPSGFFVLKSWGNFAIVAKLHNSNLLKEKNLAISKDQLQNSIYFLKNIKTEVGCSKEADQN